VLANYIDWTLPIFHIVQILICPFEEQSLWILFPHQLDDFVSLRMPRFVCVFLLKPPSLIGGSLYWVVLSPPFYYVYTCKFYSLLISMSNDFFCFLWHFKSNTSFLLPHLFSIPIFDMLFYQLKFHLIVLYLTYVTLDLNFLFPLKN
jgi:hypothetical protein